MRLQKEARNATMRHAHAATINHFRITASVPSGFHVSSVYLEKVPERKSEKGQLKQDLELSAPGNFRRMFQSSSLHHPIIGKSNSTIFE